MKIKIAHCSDLHLGSKTHQRGKNYNAINAFSAILEECESEKVDFLLISGDLFDDVNPGKFAIREVKEKLKKSGMKTVISPGNHDPYTSDSPYTDNDWPKNVFIFKSSEISYFEYTDLKLRIWGAAFENIYEKKSPLRKKLDLDDNFINICVIHGNISNSNEEFYCPIKISEIENSGMDYIALGHAHKKSNILKAGNTFYAYCGSPYSNNFNETGEKGIYIGDVSKNCCNLKFKKINKHAYEKFSLNITGINSNSSIIEKILSSLKSLYGTSYSENYYEITLLGETEESFVIKSDYIELVLSEKLHFIRIIDNTEVEIDTSKLIYRNDFKGIFVKKALDRIENSGNKTEQNINKRALKLGLKAFTEDVYYHDN